MILHFWNNWLVIAFVAPLLWGLVNLLDVYLVQDVYEDEYEGTIIMALFQCIPFLAVPWLGFPMPQYNFMLLAIVAGLFSLASMFYYFKALFRYGDATLILVLWNLVALVVPVLAFFFVGEKLVPVQYLGILVVVIGAVFLTLDKNIYGKKMRDLVLIMIGAILFLSFSMVMQEKVYSNTSFWGGFLFFSIGYLIGGAVLLGSRGMTFKKRLFEINKKYFILFALVEVVVLAGIVTSQRAIDIAPAVSLVATIESFQPAFILMLSVVIFFLLSFFSHGKKDLIKKIYEEQISGKRSKIIAILIMAAGIYLINQ